MALPLCRLDWIPSQIPGCGAGMGYSFDFIIYRNRRKSKQRLVRDLQPEVVQSAYRFPGTKKGAGHCDLSQKPAPFKNLQNVIILLFHQHFDDFTVILRMNAFPLIPGHDSGIHGSGIKIAFSHHPAKNNNAAFREIRRHI